jgi:hypothetical protein
MENMRMKDNGTVDIDLREVLRICARFDDEIEGFCRAIKTLHDEGNLSAIDVMLRIVVGKMVRLIGKDRAQNMTCFSDCITGKPWCREGMRGNF